MKRFTTLLTLFFLFGISQLCLAQKKVADDVYGRDTSTAPAKTLADSHNFSVPDFVDGYLILPDDELRYGLIRFNGSVAIFKDTITQKVKRFDAHQIKGFVAAADTFKVFTDTITVRANPYYRGYYGDQLFINTQFNQLLVYGEKISLYKALRESPNTNYNYGYGYGYRYRGSDGTLIETALYLQRKNQWGYTYVPANKRDFKKLMAYYLADDSALVSDINAGRLTYDNLDEIVKRYNDAD